MAAKSNTGYYYDPSLGSALNRHISFQTSTMDSTSEMIMMGNYYGVNRNDKGTLGNSSSNTTFRAPQATSTSSSLLLDSVPGLKHEAGLAVEWSVEEQYRLEEGLAKYADEPSILRYIKIAAMLHDKTVRDVALRCRWMTDKLLESSSKATTSSVTPLNPAAYSILRSYQSGGDYMSREALDSARHLLEQNNEVLRHISSNLSTFKVPQVNSAQELWDLPRLS